MWRYLGSRLAARMVTLRQAMPSDAKLLVLVMLEVDVKVVLVDVVVVRVVVLVAVTEVKITGAHSP